MEVFTEFTLEAAHRLPRVPQGHKCARLHGHNFCVSLHVRGPVRDDGMVVDFAAIAAAWAPVHAALDHCYLNDVEGLDNPTSENLAAWIWRRVAPALPGLYRVVVRETPSSGCAYEGR